MTAPTRETRAVAEMLDRAGAPGDGVLFVHSAFRPLGAQGFRAEAFIEGLLDYMHHGTLVMPTMTWRVVTPASPWFDERETPSHVGILAERFRLDYASHRSLHPTHSVAAFGPVADHLTSTHHVEDTPCGLTSPYGKARRMAAHIVLLGIGLERCTAIHHAEEMVAPDIYLSPPEQAETYRCRSRDGTVYQVRLRRHLRLNRDFPQFTAPLAEKGALRQGELAGTRWIAVSQRDLLAEVIGALERDPRAIIAPPGAPIIPLSP
jgi:aminoglycoside 3-N-acetyltransferase